MTVEDEPSGPSPVRLAVTAVIIVVLGAAALVLGLGIGAGDPVAPAPEVVTPEPWKYDPVTDRYWHPDHGHWHQGRPPVVSSDGSVPAPPYITDPEPWQYDEASDRHYDPAHAHWHAGRPPAGIGPDVLASPAGPGVVDPPPGITNPTPWQYDAATDRHYHPGHAHWHAGPPPDPADR